MGAVVRFISRKKRAARSTEQRAGGLCLAWLRLVCGLVVSLGGLHHIAIRQPCESQKNNSASCVNVSLSRHGVVVGVVSLSPSSPTTATCEKRNDNESLRCRPQMTESFDTNLDIVRMECFALSVAENSRRFLRERCSRSKILRISVVFIDFHLNHTTKYELDRIAWQAVVRGPYREDQRVKWSPGKVYRPRLTLGIALSDQNMPSKQRS